MNAVVLLGPPGAGKGTQAARLSASLELPHISTGEILRQAVRDGTELGRAAREIMKAGQLVGDRIVVVGSSGVTFADYEVTAPTSRVVVSVEDHGIMEFQLIFTR